ncbi:MAG: DUF2608 domain-containing protein [Calothrix sp. SM1_5_4]|nr:DUF2608 domain-containing protein [Calothrix sp. SM1_5_4]
MGDGVDRPASESGAHHRRDLVALGIDFERNSIPDSALRGFRLPQLSNAFLWSGGVAYSDGSPKGLVLKGLLEKQNLRPSRVIAIDDRIHHVHSFVEALLEMKIGGRVIHYLKALEEPPFDPRIADIQLEAFVKWGILLNDDQAHELLVSQSCERALAG